MGILSCASYATDLLYFILSFWEVILQHSTGRQPWWSDKIVFDHGKEGTLFFGAMPLHDYDHQHTMQFKENVRAVISVCNPWEMEPRKGMWHPVESKDWYTFSMQHLQIPVRDGSAPDQVELRHIVDYAMEKLKMGQTVYVHCKAGRGRSAVAAACIYMAMLKRRGCKDDPYTLAENAMEQMKRIRPQCAFNPRQREAVHAMAHAKKM